MDEKIIEAMKTLLVSNQELIDATQEYLESLAKLTEEDPERYKEFRENINAAKRQIQEILTARKGRKELKE